MNLIGNSIKFTSQGGKVILRVQQSTKTEKTVKMKFEVEDNGIGIAKEKIGTIFNSFTQAENETTRKFGGTGLGLAIVKQLVELQDGEIFVKSEPGKGSIFTFYLPFAIGTFRSIKKKQSAQIELESAKDIRLLLAEDNKINQHLAIDTIKNWQKDIQIDVAENGKETCDMVEKNDYHLIFMDVQMPEMDGIEATKYIRSNMPLEKRNIPIIAMTAHALKNEREHFIEVGMDDYLSKPFAPETLIQKISYYSGAKIQEQVKQGKKIAVINQEEIEKNRYELKSYTPESNDFEFKLIDLSYLKKIYQGDYKRIKKILTMYIETVGNEIDEIYNSYNSQKYDVVRAKSHALKPKMNYLGCTKMFENSKHIEQTLKQNGEPMQLKEHVVYLKSTWPSIENEIKSFLNN